MSEDFVEEFRKFANIERPPKNVLEGFRGLDVSLVYDTLWNRFGIDTHLIGIRPMFEFMKDKVYVGTAVTVKEVSTTHEPINVVQKRFEETGRSRIDHALAAIDFAQPGDIIVIDGEGRDDVAIWGDNMAMLAKRNGVCAVVLYGAVRDVSRIRMMEFPVFAKGVSPKGSIYYLESIGFNVPVTCGGVQVRPGDIIVGDEDGVVSVPREYAEKVLEYALETLEREKVTREAIASARYALESYPAGRPNILRKLREKGKLQ
ncbi:MAG: dimethylmenaquinone methyltransferase [Nitrososphaeria archaeon]|nr:dimethylmenaquinone methyltransferase [Nitrososphaeria archaeon]